MSEVEEIRIDTVESRIFDSNTFADRIEVEFHKSLPWLDESNVVPGRRYRGNEIEPRAVLRLAARMAVTGSAIPDFGLGRGHGVIHLNSAQRIGVAVECARFGPMPDDNDDQRFALRDRIEAAIGIRHLHIEMWGSPDVEANVSATAESLGSHQLAFSQSPVLGIEAFLAALQKARRFLIMHATEAMVGATAVGTSYELMVKEQPVIAIEIAAAGAAGYVIIKAGRAVGQRLDRLIRK